MSPFDDFGLILDFFDHLAIIGEDRSLIFVGTSLSKLLKENQIDLTHLKTGQGNFKDDLKKISEAIECVETGNKPFLFRLGGIGDDLLVFRSCKSLGEIQFFLGTKGKIIRLTRIEHDLKERVKELECLYGVTKEFETSTRIDDALVLCIKLLEAAFQYPEETIVNIEIGKKKFGLTEIDHRTVRNMIYSEINLDEKKYGEIRIYLKNDLGFLREEQMLIDEIAGKISKLIEKEEKARNYETQQKILKAKNETLLRLTEECYQKRERLRTFFNAIADTIVVVDRQYEISMSNKDGIGDEGKCYKKVFGREEPCKQCPALETFNYTKDFSIERQYNEKTFRLRSHPILGKDKKTEHVLEVCSDITNQKIMEAQLMQSYKLASLGKLVAGVAHEINNPNTFILGNLKIVQESFHDIFPILDEYYRKKNDLKIARLDYAIFKENISVLVNDMINGANRTKKIVGDLRNFAKKDNGALTDLVDLNDIIKNNLTLTRKHIKKYAQLEVDLKENLPLFKGSINKLEQVLLNLTINASESIEAGEGLIKIKTDYDEQSKEILLVVSDNGCGMNDATLKNIFDPFFTTKRDKGGIGLGLSITYGIIKDHNGRINVTSKVGSGTTFTVRIPVK